MIYANDIYSKYGNVFALDLYAPLEPVHNELVESVRYTNSVGNKTVHRYKSPPPSWGIQGRTRKPVHVELDEGSFFKPHRDMYEIKPEWLRLNCFANNSDPEKCTYIIDGKIQNFQAGRWYAMNPGLVHYSFCFAPNTVHYIVDINVADKKTLDWLVSVIPYANSQPSEAEGDK